MWISAGQSISGQGRENTACILDRPGQSNSCDPFNAAAVYIVYLDHYPLTLRGSPPPPLREYSRGGRRFFFRFYNYKKSSFKGISSCFFPVLLCHFFLFPFPPIFSSAPKIPPTTHHHQAILHNIYPCFHPSTFFKHLSAPNKKGWWSRIRVF